MDNLVSGVQGKIKSFHKEKILKTLFSPYTGDILIGQQQFAPCVQEVERQGFNLSS